MNLIILLLVFQTFHLISECNETDICTNDDRYTITNRTYNNTLYLEPYDKVAFAIENKDNEVLNLKTSSTNNKGVNKKYKALHVNIKEGVTYASIVNSVNETNIIDISLIRVVSTQDNFELQELCATLLQYYVTVCLILFVLLDQCKGCVRKLIIISFIVIELMMNLYVDVVRKFIYLIVKL